MAPPILDTLPPELLTMVVDIVEPEDHLSMKLSCKTFAQMLPDTLVNALTERYVHDADPGLKACMIRKRFPISADKAIPSIKGRTTMILARDEFYAMAQGDPPALKKYRITWDLNRLLCTLCCKIKGRQQFTDSQASCALLHERSLSWDDFSAMIPTGHVRTCITYMKWVSRPVTVDGRGCFICYSCRTPHLPDDAVDIRAEGQRRCKACCDAKGMKYTKAKKHRGYIIYDDEIDIEQLMEDGRMGGTARSSSIVAMRCRPIADLLTFGHAMECHWVVEDDQQVSCSLKHSA